MNKITNIILAITLLFACAGFLLLPHSVAYVAKGFTFLFAFAYIFLIIFNAPTTEEK